MLRAQVVMGRDLVVRTLAFQACFVSAAAVAARFGAAAVAAHQVVLQLWSFLALVLDSLAIAAQSLVGAALGAGQLAHAKSVAWRVTVFSTLAAAVLAAVFAVGSSAFPAALFAFHYRTKRTAPRYGSTDLPRLMRSFGSSGRTGPGHPGTRAALNVMVRTRTLQPLRPHLLRVIRNAAVDGKAPSWSRLFDDLTDWGPAVRGRWAVQFYSLNPPSHSARQTKPASPLSTEQDPTTA